MKWRFCIFFPLYSFHAAFFSAWSIQNFNQKPKTKKQNKQIENQTIHGQILPDKLMWVLKCSLTL